MIEAAFTLAKKDLKGFFRDRGALVASLLVPIMLVTVFGAIMTYAFGGGSSGMPQVSLYVCDLDQTPRSENFLSQLKSTDMVRVREVDTTKLPSTPEAIRAALEKLVSDGDAHHVLVIPKDFSITSDESDSRLQMIRDPGRSMEDRIVSISIMQAALTQANGSIFTDAMENMLEEQGMEPEQLGQITGWMDSIGSTIGNFVELQNTRSPSNAPNDPIQASDADEQASEVAQSGTTEGDSQSGLDAILEFFSDAVPVDTTDIKPPERDSQITYQQAQSVAGMSVMMLLFALTSCGSILLAERQDGTLRRLFACPIPRDSILLGKFLFLFAIGFLQLAVLFTYGELVFHVGLFRDPATLLVLGLTWIATGGAFGMFLATACKSAKQAEGLSTLLILMMAALGGCWFPLQMMNLPTWLDALCKSTMTYWAMSGFQGMLWNQLHWTSDKLLFALGCQWAWAIFLAVVSVVLYRRNYQSN